MFINLFQHLLGKCKLLQGVWSSSSCSMGSCEAMWLFSVNPLFHESSFPRILFSPVKHSGGRNFTGYFIIGIWLIYTGLWRMQIAETKVCRDVFSICVGHSHPAAISWKVVSPWGREAAWSRICQRRHEEHLRDMEREGQSISTRTSQCNLWE